MQRRRDRRSRARKIGLMASVLALGAIGLVVLSGNYLPPAHAFFLFAVAGALTLVHAVSYVCDRLGKTVAAMTTKADTKREGEFGERDV